MKVLAVCLIAFLAFTNVQSASFQYRNGREVLLQQDEAIRAEEFVAELKKEAEQVAIEEAVPLVLEEIIVPVETLRNIENVVAVEEPVAVEAAAVADQELVVPVSALRDAVDELVAVPEAVFVQEVRAESPEAVAAEEVIVAKSAEDVQQIIADQVAETVDAVNEAAVVKALAPVADEVAQVDEAVVPVDAVLRQAAAAASDATTPPRPTLLQVAQTTINNLIANNPITNALNAIRNPSSADTPVVESVQSDAAAPASPAAVAAPDAPAATDAAAPATPDASAAPAAPAAPAATGSRPTLAQQIQTNVQNIQHQFQAALQNVQTSAAGAIGGANRPNLIQTIQTALNRPLQAIFRPSTSSDTENAAHDAVAADDVVAAPAPVVSAVAAAPVPVVAVVAEDTPAQVVSIVKEGIEVVADKIDDEIKPATAA